MTSPPPRTNESRPRAITALATAGLLLAMAGCTSAPAPATPTLQAPVTVPGPGSAPGSTTGSPSGTTELAYLDAAALKGAVQQWADATAGTKVNDQDALRGHLPAAEKWLEGITVVPAKCGLYGIGSLKEQLDQAAMAAAVLPPEAGGDLTVASYRDRDALVADVAAQQHLDESCGKYTVSADGQKITSTLSRLEATSSAPYTSATMLESVNGKAKTRRVSVRAIDGHTMLTATRTVKGTAEETTALALADVESMLGILRGIGPAAAAAS
ncbi:hypothetical protein BLJ79_15610 [Arthrobacter sp. UCD-GKA]|uniref:hypothetical protein n=1 Tax=Arthrobacter sp. UCD-GKA TaxID=1913576 RepID=UPI0008DE426C|nr:hypothetical protein [Arthrobacter sp. UCD-GKA]OIH83489.1 hypothetical protein BLJ79_15610 [Arthrobacter sp. UCD-GKA]